MKEEKLIILNNFKNAYLYLERKKNNTVDFTIYNASDKKDNCKLCFFSRLITALKIIISGRDKVSCVNLDEFNTDRIVNFLK